MEELTVHNDLIKIVSFNILAPCYKRMNVIISPINSSTLLNQTETNHLSQTTPSAGTEKHFESEQADLFLPRNESICQKLLEADADIICIQEFWSGSPAIRALYEEALCNGKYQSYYIERTAHWSERKDGLAVFIRCKKFVVEDRRDIYFHDCGDRVALMLVLGLIPKDPLAKLQRFICVNTHLLFPHDDSCSKIRLREVTKLIGYIEAYKLRQLCADVCVRGDVRLPVIIAGDFNGDYRGHVYRFMKCQNFHSAYEDYCSTSSEASFTKWISHRNHRKDLTAVDHIFYSNSSWQTTEALKSTACPDWTNLVYREVAEKILTMHKLKISQDSEETLDIRNALEEVLKELFDHFDADHDKMVSLEDFTRVLNHLGFMGKEGAALTKEEVAVIAQTVDRDGDEFYDRFWLAWELSTSDLSPRQSATEKEETKEREDALLAGSRLYARSKWLGDQCPLLNSLGSYEKLSWLDDEPMADLTVRKVELYPSCLADGIWPSDYDLSDHGMVTVSFALAEERG
eukprot:scaffold471_cov318-Ochromonas_danica.AAC.14